MESAVAKYVYGIVEDTVSPPSATGIAGAPVDLIAGDGAAALVSDLPDEQLKAGREEILVHSRVLEQAMEHGTVLPMRFGIVMEGPAAVRRELLDRHADDLRAQLQRLEGKVEVTVRAVYEQDTILREVLREDHDIARLQASLRDQPDDATYYGRIRLGELIAAAVDRKRELDSTEVLDALTPYALQCEVAEPAHEQVALAASFLVERERLGEFDEAVDRVAREQSHRMRFKYTGPLPPHSFVELAGRA